MAAVSTKGQRWLLTWSVFQIALVTLILNTQVLFYGPLYRWPGIVVPVLITAGFIGALLRRKWMLNFGWAGVGLFLYVICVTAIPDEEYISSGPNPPNLVSGEYALSRFSLLLGAGISLAVCFRLLGKAFASGAETSSGR